MPCVRVPEPLLPAKAVRCHVHAGGRPFPARQPHGPRHRGRRRGGGGRGGGRKGLFIAAVPCMPAARASASPLHPQDRRRSANGSRTARRPWILASPRIRARRPFWRRPSPPSRKVRACCAAAGGMIRAVVWHLGRCAELELRISAQPRKRKCNQGAAKPPRAGKAEAAAAARQAGPPAQRRRPLLGFRRAALRLGNRGEREF